MQAARQQLAATQQQIASVLADLGGNADIPPDRHPQVQQAQAALDRARLNLSYTVVAAPDDGTVTKVEQLQVGDYVTTAQPLFALISDSRVWIEANFKETDLTHMRPGQAATVDIDTYPDHGFEARVTSLSPGTGSAFSLLPPENATGNWVKVVQRLPVRLQLERLPEDVRLHAGMSATVDVDTQYRRRLLTMIESAFAAPEARGERAMTPPPSGVGDQPEIHRGLITVSIMLATIMQALDVTIANVALPHIQGSLSAAADQITWVLTSYIVASAIATPLTGWLAGRFGRKRVFLVSVAGFTVASALCGMAGSLTQIVLFRLLQGLCGAALVPLSQAVLLDINPPEKHGSAMAVWGAGIMVGPILGPALGGWLTDNYSWRWVFYINLPVGLLAFLGIAAFIHDHRRSDPPRFDFFGFASLSLGVGALQMMLDRGELKGWFEFVGDLGGGHIVRPRLLSLRRSYGDQPDGHLPEPRLAQGPQFRRRDHLHLRYRGHSFCHDGAAAAHAAGAVRLSGHHDRTGDRLPRHRNPGRHEPGRAAGRPGGYPPDAPFRLVPDRLRDVADDQFQFADGDAAGGPLRAVAGLRSRLPVRAAHRGRLCHP